MVRAMDDGERDAPPPEPGLGDLVGQLSEQASRLARNEVALAKLELQQSVKHIGIGTGLFGSAGVLALLGLATLIGAAVAALSLVMDVWLAALIVAIVLFALAGVAALIGKKQVGRAGPPEHAIQNVKQDIAEVKGHRA